VNYDIRKAPESQKRRNGGRGGGVRYRLTQHFRKYFAKMQSRVTLKVAENQSNPSLGNNIITNYYS